MRSRDATDSAARPVVPAPRANPDLLGHAAVEAELRRLFDNGRLPHALLLGLIVGFYELAKAVFRR